MAKMRFTPELASFLKEYKYIYTVRRFRYSPSDRCVEIDGVGICQRQLVNIHVDSKRDLAEYVDKSGFKTVDGWWKAIKSFNKGYVGPFYLYEITLEGVDE